MVGESTIFCPQTWLDRSHIETQNRSKDNNNNNNRSSGSGRAAAFDDAVAAAVFVSVFFLFFFFICDAKLTTSDRGRSDTINDIKKNVN